MLQKQKEERKMTEFEQTIHEFVEFFKRYHNEPEFRESFNDNMDKLMEQWRRKRNDKM